MSLEISRRSRMRDSSNSLEACRYLAMASWRDLLFFSELPVLVGELPVFVGELPLQVFDVARFGRRRGRPVRVRPARPPSAVDDFDGDVVLAV